MNEVKISVLMPVYNGQEFLEQAIDSIMDQTFRDWELIIINDGSTDRSENIIFKFIDTRIKYLKNEENLGLIKTLNRGIALCKGKYIARMDADDISCKTRLEKQYHFLEKNKNLAMIGNNAFIIDQDNAKKGRIINLRTSQLLKINLLFSVPFIHPSVIIRSYVLIENQYDENYKDAEDYDLWCRIANKYEIGNIKNYLLKYRWHTSNISVINSDNQNDKKDEIIIRQLNQNLGINPTKEELLLHKVTFKQYDVKDNIATESFQDYKDLNNWFSKIIIANKEHQKYDHNLLIAYLWSRWIVLCIKQKKRIQIFKQSFVSYNLSVIKNTIKIIWFLSKKKNPTKNNFLSWIFYIF